MWQRIKDTVKPVVFNTPFLLDLYLQRKFRVERELLEGIRAPKSDRSSVIHFSMNKAATQYTKDILVQCAQENGMTPAHFNEYAFYTQLPYLTGLSRDEMKDYRHIFQPHGYLYTAFGGFVQGIENLEDYRVVLMVRDPRDVLVSWYYSLAYSHSIPPASSSRHQEYLRKRKEARKMTVDEHVLSKSDRMLTIYNNYLEGLLGHHQDPFMTSYEQMTADFPAWLERLLTYCGFEIRERDFQQLVERHQALQPDQEDKQEHIRKGKPGDYLDKLQPETIAQLNEKYSLILEEFEPVLRKDRKAS